MYQNTRVSIESQDRIQVELDTDEAEQIMVNVNVTHFMFLSVEKARELADKLLQAVQEAETEAERVL